MSKPPEYVCAEDNGHTRPYVLESTEAPYPPDSDLNTLESFASSELGKINGIGELVFSDNGKSAKVSAFNIDTRAVVSGLHSQGINISVERALQTFPFYLDLFFDPEVVAYVDDIGKNDIARFALECALNPLCISEIQLRIGIGIHDGGDHLLRLPAYIAPAIRIMKKLADHYGESVTWTEKDLDSLLPLIVIYSASNMVATVNQLNLSTAAGNRDYYFGIFERYAKHVLPDSFMRRISFRNDEVTIPEYISSAIRAEAQALFEQHSDVPPVARVIKTAQRHNSDPVDGLAYAAAHALYSLDGIKGLPSGAGLIESEQTLPPPSKLIMIGGKSEIEYWMIRKMVADPENRILRAQIVHRFSELPPYSPSPHLLQQDITLRDLEAMPDAGAFANRLSNIRSAFKKDIELVCRGIEDPVSYLKYLFGV